MGRYNGPERRSENLRLQERADEAHDKAVEALNRIERHEGECVLYRQQTADTLHRIEAMLSNLFGKAWKAIGALIFALISLSGFLLARQIGLL